VPSECSWSWSRYCLHALLVNDPYISLPSSTSRCCCHGDRPSTPPEPALDLLIRALHPPNSCTRLVFVGRSRDARVSEGTKSRVELFWRMAEMRLVGARRRLGEWDRTAAILLECAVIYAVARPGGVETADRVIMVEGEVRSPCATESGNRRWIYCRRKLMRMSFRMN
jgi:hypothetical protein